MKVIVSLMGVPSARFKDKNLRVPARFFQLLAILQAAPDMSLARANVAQILWDSAEKRTALVNLRQLIARARKAVGDERAIIVTENTIALDPTRIRFDLDLLDDNFASLDHVTRFWRGPLLDDGAPESDAFSEWLAQRRSEIVSAYYRLVQMSLHMETFPGRSNATDIAAVEDILLHLDAERPQTYHTLIEAYGRIGAEHDVLRLHERYKEAGLENDPSLSKRVRRWATVRDVQSQVETSRPKVAIIVQRSDSGAFHYLAPVAMDVLAALSRFRSFRVLAPTVTADGWLVGSQYKTVHDFNFALVLHAPTYGGAQDIGFTLIETRTKSAVWSHRLRLGVFGINEQMGEMISDLIPQLAKRIITNAAHPAYLTQDNLVYQSYLSAQNLIEQADLPSIRRARSALKRAYHDDDRFSEALGAISFTLFHEWKLLGGSDPSLITTATEIAEQAIQSNPHSPLSYIVRARAAIHMRDFDGALPILEEAKIIFPNAPNLALEYADTLSHLDHRDAAWDALQVALELHTDLTNHQLWAAASISLFSRHYDAARAFCERITSPDIALGVRTASHAMSGDAEGAAFWARKFKEALPNVTTAQLLRTTPFATKDAVEPYVQGLQSVGIP